VLRPLLTEYLVERKNLGRVHWAVTIFFFSDPYHVLLFNALKRSTRVPLVVLWVEQGPNPNGDFNPAAAGHLFLAVQLETASVAEFIYVGLRDQIRTFVVDGVYSWILSMWVG
jgi:hypothetical protein